MNENYNLERFINAQDRVYETVLSELISGTKTSHWMWFVFPQIKGLGSTTISQKYAISNLDEAKAYYDNEILCERLCECTELVLNIAGKNIEQIFGYPDYLKFGSSMTLFAQASETPDVFIQAIEKYFAGEMDNRTLELL